MARRTMELVRPNERTVEEWAEYIGVTWGRVAENLIATGARLLEARSEEGDETYAEILARLRMRPETAADLIRISECDRIARGQFPALPNTVDTLLELAQMSEEEWDLAEQSNLIHTNLRRAEVRKFRKAAKREVDKDDAERVDTATADPTISVDPEAQAAFKREAALLGSVDRLERYLDEADPEALAAELEPRMRAHILGKIRAAIGRLATLADALEAADG